jgi:hypothetical protein
MEKVQSRKHVYLLQHSDIVLQFVQALPETHAYIKSIWAEIKEIKHECIVLMFQMETVDILEAFWNLYQTGGLLTSLSHDILPPQRRQHMIMDAKNDGIELEESDFCLQITIKESDYLFVKDVLTRKNGRFEIERDIYFTNSLSVIYIYIYIYVWKLNQTVLELDL